MERKLEVPADRKQKLEELGKKNSLEGKLAQLVLPRYCDSSLLHEPLQKVYGKSIYQLNDLEEVWHKKLMQAIVQVTDEEYAQKIQDIIKIRLEGQYSTSIYRRSFRSQKLSYYIGSVIETICSLGHLYQYGLSADEFLLYDHENLYKYDYLLAYEIRKGNTNVIEKIKDAIYQENGDLRISRKIIRAIIISGDDDLLEDLFKLLKAAKLQEGLRQAVLENADCAQPKTLAKIMQFCILENLFRFSSVIRAFDTWVGFGYGDVDQKTLQKYAPLAYACLSDPDQRRIFLNSHNHLEVYFALWATACYEVDDTFPLIQKYLDEGTHDLKVLAWMFVMHTDSNAYQMSMASKYLDERDEELLSWIIPNLAITQKLVYSYSLYKEGFVIKPITNENLPSSLEDRKKIYEQLKDIVLFIGNKTPKFSGNPFPFTAIQLDKTLAVSCMMSLAGYDLNEEMVNDLFTMIPQMDVTQRMALIVHFIDEGKRTHHAVLRELLADRAVSVKELASKRMAEIPLAKEDLLALQQALRSKSSSFRKEILTVLKKQNQDVLTDVIKALLLAKEDTEIQAGIELLNDKNELMDTCQEEINQLKEQELSTQTQILFNQLIQTEDTVFTPENGYGLYDPSVEIKRVEKKQPKGVLDKLFKKSSDGLYSEKQLQGLTLSDPDIVRILKNMNDVIERHKDYEYDTMLWDGTKQKVVFGNVTSIQIRVPVEYGWTPYNIKLEMVPFHEEFIEAAGDCATNPDRILQLMFTTARSYTHYSDSAENADWYKKYEKKNLDLTCSTYGWKTYAQRYWLMVSVIELFYELIDPRILFEKACLIYRSMLAQVDEEDLGKDTLQTKAGKSGYWKTTEYLINRRFLTFWRHLVSRIELTDKEFEEWFLLQAEYEKKSGVKVLYSLVMQDYFRAADQKIVPEDILYRYLLEHEDKIRILTNPVRFKEGQAVYDAYPWSKDFVKSLTERIVEVEQKRGELPTPLTNDARAIQQFKGGRFFISLLGALGKDTFFRGYSYGADSTKKSVLSHLLKCCYPNEDEDFEKMMQMWKNTDISEKRLVEAAMYAPQWAELVEQMTGWKGLKKGIWFFHAHISDRFSAQKETEVALYSTITPTQFNDGAFDENWFREVYEELGEKRFKILYQSAKYITSGGNHHKRSQLYVDAVLGKLNADEIEKEIIDKRNQDRLRCYPLIPFTKETDALHRYLFLQEFYKQSKQFGAQRRESEKKAYQSALQNLAVTKGVYDVDRLIWQMETEQFDSMKQLLEKQDVEDTVVYLQIDEEGDAELVIEKNGKKLKSVPKNIQKNEKILSLKETVKELKDQKKRARETLERAMTEAVEFTSKELIQILSHPVLSPSIRKLLFHYDDQDGFIFTKDNQLYIGTLSGDEMAEGRLRISHPHDLQRNGTWLSYMHLLYEKQLVQPFKQVFREYYPITAEEKEERVISRRYAGYQVQPQKTVALLKSRGWTVDYEEGLQKVFHKEDLIVRMYAMADWFSPADIEAPTLETISFYHRNSYEKVPFEEIPPILFSEVMRDIDLVVSVAHVGGTDPETSHSTIEMRIAITKELCQMLKKENIECRESHAFIKGKLAEYTVHMGSGVVHAMGIGMVNILPVHSQARGRMFLPFADDDPKTAEILSKILLLSEDGKIKDPSILSQLEQ